MDVLPEPDDTPTEAVSLRAAMLSRVRRRIFWGAVMLVALTVLGAGAFAAQQLSHGRDTHVVGDPGDPTDIPVYGPPTPAQAMSAASAAPSASISASASARASASASASVSASAQPAGSPTGARVITPHIPLPVPPPTPPPAPDVRVSNSGSMPKDHHTLRVVTARGDLTGQRELAWAADAGYPVGDARCTSDVRIGSHSSPAVRSTLLLCWHTSATKSVVTIAVDIDHPPSDRESVAILDRVWNSMS